MASNISFTAAEFDDPLIKTLPPATDYLTYLTVLEYQLTPDRLPLLHKILQHEDLTINIGWDLVHLLIPLLPASEACLLDIARLGNPREVVLRVSESLVNLENLKLPNQDENQSVSDEDDEKALSRDEEDEDVTQPEIAPEEELPIHVVRFNTLISMLAILQSRIKTKYPSRFLATSLDAALKAYEFSTTAATTESLLAFIRGVSPRKRPALPPRRSSVHVPTRPQPGKDNVPDPEADVSDTYSSTEETAKCLRLLQYGLLDILRGYVASLAHVDPPGMFWTARWEEKKASATSALYPTSFTKLFAEDDGLQMRDHVVGHIAVCDQAMSLSRG